jgi:hypothetical protein
VVLLTGLGYFGWMPCGGIFVPSVLAASGFMVFIEVLPNRDSDTDSTLGRGAA